MRTIVKIEFNGDDSPGGPEPLLRAAGCGPDVTAIEELSALSKLNVAVTLDLTDDRFSGLVHLLLRHRIQWFEEREDIYSEKEYDRARLILVGPGKYFRIKSGQELGTKFSMDHACQTCGAGARQTSPLMIDAWALWHLEGVRATATLYYDILVDNALAKELEKLNVKGLSLHDVYAAAQDRAPTKLPWKQLRAARAMPPMSPTSTGWRIDKTCPACKQNSHCAEAFSEEPFRLAYAAKDLSDLEEVMTTRETFGHSAYYGDVAQALFPYPYFLLTPRVMRVIRAAEPKALKFWPIRVVPSSYDP